MKTLLLLFLSLTTAQAGIPWDFIKFFDGKFHISTEFFDPFIINYYAGYHYRCWVFFDEEGNFDHWSGAKITDEKWHDLLGARNRLEVMAVLNSIEWTQDDDAQCAEWWSAPGNPHP